MGMESTTVTGARGDRLRLLVAALAITTTVGYGVLTYAFSALLGPVFARMLMNVSGGAPTMTIEHYQSAFQPLLYGVALAIVLTLLLKETGPAARRTAPERRSSRQTATRARESFVGRR